MPPSCPCPECRYARMTSAWSGSPHLDRERSDLPILATRAARLRPGDTPFGSINHSFGWFGVEAVADCNGGSVLRDWHRPGEGSPGQHCLCGFYALPADRRPAYAGDEFVQLDVLLAGRVIVHERGYRAGWQRVLKVRVPPCGACGRARRWYYRDPDRAEQLRLACPPCLRRSCRWKPEDLDLRPIEPMLEELAVPGEVDV